MIDKFVSEGLRGKSATTIKTYAHALKQFERWLDGSGTNLNEYSRSDVQQYIDYQMKRKQSAATINKVWNAIKKFSNWNNKADTIEDISVIKQQDIKHEAPSSLSQNERRGLIREVDRQGNKRDIGIITTLLNTGLRVSELVSLDVSDIEITERKGSLRVIGKGNKERTIPLNNETRRAIEKYLEERSGNDEAALFISNRGERISVRSVQHLVNKFGFNVHQLRHTFITDLVRSGKDISLIQSLSGHSSADMILRYSAPSEDDKQAAVEDLYK
ncbi:tyrosine-type recombinase/integrase [Neobacillus sp. BF23-41]|uniref:tyrosine-type recombinase/integrase n=1 Tax=Neobacillus sp. BF23-41 TaxID=3240280 RepID=UPI0034E58DB5